MYKKNEDIVSWVNLILSDWDDAEQEYLKAVKDKDEMSDINFGVMLGYRRTIFLLQEYLMAKYVGDDIKKILDDYSINFDVDSKKPLYK